MSSPQVHPEGEILPPPHPSAPAEAYSPEQARRRREFSVWDPRSAPGTYLLLAINIAVYLWMIAHRVDPNNPTEQDLIRYGANDTLLVLHGQWYRLLTATFVHVGFIHIATNIAHALAYHDPSSLFQVGAGASGAVFGIAGILIVLLSNRRLPFPWAELKRLRSSVIKFAVINLVIGLSTNVINVGINIDNSAHIGGFLSGLALGVPLSPRMTAGRDRYLNRQKITFAAACLLLALIGYGIANLL